nr:hypothetical protein [Cytophagales bacterium]
MKKTAYFLSLVFLLNAFVPVAMASGGKEPITLSAEEAERLDELKHRVEEIKAMDFSELSKVEKKAIKKELREINKEAKAVGGGVYISAGAIIIILVILLIIT